MKLTRTQRQTLTSIRNFHDRNRRWPTIADLCERLGLTHREAHGRVIAYAKAKWIRVETQAFESGTGHVLTAAGERALTERKR